MWCVMHRVVLCCDLAGDETMARYREGLHTLNQLVLARLYHIAIPSRCYMMALYEVVHSPLLVCAMLPINERWRYLAEVIWIAIPIG